MNDRKKLKVFAGVVIGVLIGATVLIVKGTGEFDIGMILAMTGAMIGSAFVSYLLSIRKKKQNGNIPEVDERTIKVLKNYFLWAFYFVMIGSGLISFILFLMDVKTVELGMLFTYQVLLFMIVAVGAVVAKRVG